MSSEPDTIRNVPEKKHCAICHGSLRVRNTKSRTVKTLSGLVSVTNVTLTCPRHKREIYRPGNRLTPPGSSYGYDVLAEVGRLRYAEHKQIEEISQMLAEKGCKVPPRTVAHLCDRYLEHITAVHLDSLPVLDTLVRQRGGYVLHIDGTGNKGRMVLLMKDAWIGIRLCAVSVQSEAADHVIPWLEYVKTHFGPPVAVVRDMSKGLKAAVSKVFPNTYVIVCHYHFLRDVGQRLFDGLYHGFRNRIDRRGVKKRLRAIRRIVRARKEPDEDASMALAVVERILAYRRDAKGLAYPFSLPAVDFYRRCDQAGVNVRTAILDRAKKNLCSPMLSHVEDALNLLKPPPAVIGRLQSDYEALVQRWQWFNRIRRVLRYRNGPIPLSTRITLSERNLERGRKMLDWLIEKIRGLENSGGYDHHARTLRKILRGVAKLIEAHRESLFAPNVTVTVNGVTKRMRVPRTNATVEGDYRLVRRHGRRIRGCGDVESQVQREGAGMLLAENLKNQTYVSTVYGSLHRIPNRFSTVSRDGLALAKSHLWGSRGPTRGRNPRWLQ